MMELSLEQLIVNGNVNIPPGDQPKVLDFSEAPGLFVKSILIPKRESLVPQHSHKYGHLTMLALGEIMVWKDGSFSGRYKAPAGIYIPPNGKHTFLTLTDNVLLYCIHSLLGRESEIEILEEHNFVNLPG